MAEPQHDPGTRRVDETAPSRRTVLSLGAVSSGRAVLIRGIG